MCTWRSEDNILFQTESLTHWNFRVRASLGGPPASRGLPNAVCHLTIARITGKHTWLLTRVLYKSQVLMPTRQPLSFPTEAMPQLLLIFTEVTST